MENFPARFLKWTGSRDAAVKRPFVQSSSKPTSELIKTNLLVRLEEWAKALGNEGADVPRAIFLAGGPGNGKSAALEYVVQKLCALYYNVAPELEQRYQVRTLPRKVEVRGDFAGYNKLVIVQDATIPGGTNLGSDEALINDLRGHVIGHQDTLYLCCINRGILAQATSKAHTKEGDTELTSLLDKIMKSLELTHNPIDCWPLKQFGYIGVWPMEIESLVDQNIYDQEKGTPLHQIIEIATKENNWGNHQDCTAGELCPFELNRQILSKKQYVDNLVKLLHTFELKSGRRWNFRELFALVAYLFVGDENDFRKNESFISPCEWAGEMVEKINGNPRSDKDIVALFKLCDKLYYHSLFPKWDLPDDLKEKYEDKIRSKLDSLPRANIDGYFNIFSSQQVNTYSSITKTIKENLGPKLEPGLTVDHNPIIEGNKTSVNDIEYDFSHSIELGIDRVKTFNITQLESLFLDRIREIEESIDASKDVAKTYAHIFYALQESVRTFACRFAKRNLGTKFNIPLNSELVNEYKATLQNFEKFVLLKDTFRKMLHSARGQNRNAFEISLSTTFGQPEPRPENDVFLRGPSLSVNVDRPDPKPKSRPSIYMQFFVVKGQPIALTFDLFSAIKEVDKGLESSTLPREVFALLDSTRAKALGQIINDKTQFDDISINIGKTKESIRYEKTIGFLTEKK